MGTVNSLKWQNVAAGGVQFVSATLLLVLYLTVSSYKEKARPGILYSDKLIIGENGTTVENKELAGSNYELFWLLLAVPVTTMLFHFLQAILLAINEERQITITPKTPLPSWTDWYARLHFGINSIRWIEYSISAAIMTWIIAQLVGITNIYLLWALAGVMNPALQFQGWAHERVNYKALLGHGYVVNWVPFISGTIIFVGQWTIMACYFFRTINSDTPGFVIAVFVTMLILFAGFAIILVIRAFNAPMHPNEVKDKWLQTVQSYETAQIWLSVVSKVSLDWIVFGGIIAS